MKRAAMVLFRIMAMLPPDFVMLALLVCVTARGCT